MKRVLIIRRDNIGDLVCTTPLFSALREALPNAYLAALVNSYNAEALHDNPVLDDVFVYTKAKHSERSKLRVWWDTWRLMRSLRAKQFGLVLLPSGGDQAHALKLARMIKPGKVAGFAPTKGLDVTVPADNKPQLEAERILKLLPALGLRRGKLSPASTFPRNEERAAARMALVQANIEPGPRKPLIGLHISARKPRQRWPAERFVELAARLNKATGAAFMLFWSPGDEDHPQHPGDDRKAREIIAACQERNLPLLPYPTERLEQLIGGLSVCQSVICSDGGAMHLAAGLGKPMVCLFGNSDAKVWAPCGSAPFKILQPASQTVADISVDEVAATWRRLHIGQIR